MANFILIGICILAGLLLRNRGVLPAGSHKGINTFIIYLALPAVSFKYLPHTQWNRSLLMPVIGPIIIWLGAWLYIRLYASTNKLSKPTEGGLKLVTGLSNTSFVGFPLVTAWFGEKELGTAVICDQVTFMLLATAGIVVAINSSGKYVLQPSVVLKKLVSFPPFIGCIAALIIPRFIDITALDPLFDKLSATVGPLALFSIGLQLQFKGWREEVKHISVALFYKLLLAPLLVLVVALILGMKGIISQVTVFEAAMPTLLSSVIVVDQYNLRPQLASLITGIGILLSFITTIAWYYIIKSAL
jgi:malate permease and related proteins